MVAREKKFIYQINQLLKSKIKEIVAEKMVDNSECNSSRNQKTP